MHAFLTFAAEAVEDEPSKAAFYVAGCLLALWALLVSAIGISRHREWPASARAARGVMGISVVLVLATMASAALTG